MSAFPIDSVLAKLAPFFSGCADELIDLREAVLQSRNAGRCVHCYFALYGRARAAGAGRLYPLKRWIERHLEIVALDESGNELERVPFLLHAEDLESLCRRIMDEFHLDRVYDESVCLRFDFREAEAA